MKTKLKTETKKVASHQTITKHTPIVVILNLAVR